MPKVETWLNKEQIEAIENLRGEQSRSNWIKEAVAEKIMRTDYEDKFDLMLQELIKTFKDECWKRTEIVLKKVLGDKEVELMAKEWWGIKE